MYVCTVHTYIHNTSALTTLDVGAKICGHGHLKMAPRTATNALYLEVREGQFASIESLRICRVELGSLRTTDSYFVMKVNENTGKEKVKIFKRNSSSAMH
jgi:hypothetical protein